MRESRCSLILPFVATEAMPGEVCRLPCSESHSTIGDETLAVSRNSSLSHFDGTRRCSSIDFQISRSTIILGIAS